MANVKHVTGLAKCQKDIGKSIEHCIHLFLEDDSIIISVTKSFDIVDIICTEDNSEHTCSLAELTQ
jgi:hypothetical protein